MKVEPEASGVCFYEAEPNTLSFRRCAVLHVLPLLSVMASAPAETDLAARAVPRNMQVRVKADGSMWARADVYAETLGGSVGIEEEEKLVVLCIEQRCIPLRVGADAEVRNGKPYVRVDRLMQAFGVAEAPRSGVGLRPGEASPDFTLESLVGKSVSLSD